MKKILTLSLLLLCVFSTGVQAQTSTSTKSATKQGAKRGPIFRATKEQINQAQAILKDRGLTPESNSASLTMRREKDCGSISRRRGSR